MIALHAPVPDAEPVAATMVREYGIRYTRHRDGLQSVTNYGHNRAIAERDLAARSVLGRDAELVTHTVTITPWTPVEARP